MTYIDSRRNIDQPQNQIAEPLSLRGGCYCGKLKFLLKLENKDDAKSSICHCTDCKKAFGGIFGATVKVFLQGFKYTVDSGTPTVHKSNHRNGSVWYREFCNRCGSHMCEYSEQAKDHFRFVTLGSFDEPSALPPKGEFYCSQREDWMPQIPGLSQENGPGHH